MHFASSQASNFAKHWRNTSNLGALFRTNSGTERKNLLKIENMQWNVLVKSKISPAYAFYAKSKIPLSPKS